MSLITTNIYGRTVTSELKNSDGSMWCRTWSDGWKEQGGIITNQTGTITYLKPFKDNKYSAFLQYSDNLIATVVASAYNSMSNRTNSSFGYYRQTENLTSWYACGY